MHPLDGAIVSNHHVKGLVQDLDHHASLMHLTKHLGGGAGGKGRWEGQVGGAGGWGRWEEQGGKGKLCDAV